MFSLALNLRRLLARRGLTVEQAVEATGLNQRTIRGILRGTKPHARTLRRLADGLGVAVDELFQSPSLLTHRLFDRRTNPLVEDMIGSQPQLFEGWTEGDFDELYSRFGTGGALTEAGIADVAAAMNQHRHIHQQVAVLLESAEAELLIGFVDLLYQKITLPSDSWTVTT